MITCFFSNWYIPEIIIEMIVGKRIMAADLNSIESTERSFDK